jgi:hypothetical protein
MREEGRKVTGGEQCSEKKREDYTRNQTIGRHGIRY